jgi:3-oxoacyl-[acyl-carrier protein] reductase
LHAPLESSLHDWLGAWDHTLAVNLVAPAVLCRAAIGAFASQPEGGIIVNVTSVTAHRGALPDHWPYGAAKGGLASMTRTIARHYGRQGVTAFVVAPGFVDTPMSRTILDEDGFRAVADATGLGEVTQPQDVADVIAFLASGRARHATGTTIDVNAAGYCR